MTQLLSDLRHALRLLARDRIFTLATILTLGLCLGAHAAIFTVVNAVLLRPLPVPDAGRLMWIANSYPQAGVVDADNSVPDYYDRREAVDAFDEVALYVRVGRTLGMRDGAERVQGMLATPSLFRLAQASPLRGRTLDDADGEPGEDRKVVLSYGLWQQLFGGSDAAIGREIRINGAPYLVIGVMRRDFLFVDPDVRFWLPLAFTAEERADTERHNNNYAMIGRLRPGATQADAQRQVDALNAANLERFPELKPLLINAGFGTRVEPLRERLVREVRGTLVLLWGGVLFVLLIGTVNVANLALARATARAREFATRRALGAGRWQLTRQLLTESLVLTAVSGAAGAVAAYWVLQAVTAAAGDRIPRASEIAVDATSVAATAVLTVLVGALTAVLPLARVSRIDVARAVRDEGRTGTAGRGATAVRRTLVTAQVAFAFVLLTGAGLMFASFRQLLQVETGFDPRSVLSAKVNLPVDDDQTIVSFMDGVLERVRRLPGVTSAGLASSAPFAGGYSDSVILAEGYEPAPGESVISPARNVVSPGYFETLRIPLRRGRLLDARDVAAAPQVAVVDERLARRFWPGQDPVGRRMWQPGTPEEAQRPGPHSRWVTVVGVVGDVRQRGLASEHERLGAYYFPLAQTPQRTMALVARAAGDPLALAPAVRREVAALDPEVPVFDVQAMEDRIEGSVAGRRTAMQLGAAFGLVALVLASVGIYGVLAYQVTQRRREIGIRIALGSDARRVFALVLGEGAALVGAGLAIGLAGAVAVRRALEGELYGVNALEPRVLAAMGALLALVALAACALPARRAARIDPAVTLAE